MAWKSYQFDDFTAQALYNILKLRVEVFVVEQNCPYPELDGLDEVSTHIVYEEDGKVLAYRQGLTPHAIYKLVNRYTTQAGLPPVKPHDLRRTAALLSRRGGATIEQVQLMLGHASPQTTSNYIGEGLDLEDNAVDYNPLRL